MSNRIYIPLINSIKFVEKDPVAFPQYDKPLFDYSLFKDQQYDWQYQTCYAQKRTRFDADFFQFTANYDPIQIEFRRKCDDALFDSLLAQKVRRNQYQTDYYIYQLGISYANLSPGLYYMKMTTGGIKEFISEDIEILPSVKNTALVEYANSIYHQDVVFETGITMAMRVMGGIGHYTPGIKSVVYEDQVLNSTVLNMQPYRTWKFFVGGPSGVPAYEIDKINRILGCDNLRINGKFYSLADGAKWEEFEEEKYTLSGWAIDLRESLNRSSSIFDTEVGNERKLMVIHNIESKGFGDTSDNTGSNIVPIIDIE
jgi:hypothetical protein